MKRRLLKLFSGVALAWITTAGVQAQLRPDATLAKDTSITVGKLANGLTYYVKPNSKPEKKVELRLVINTGSLLETDAQQGLAHFMEHMEFNGLKHYPKNDLVDYLQKIGVSFGSDLNANTGPDRTYYILPVPTDRPENLEKGFQIVADWAGGALISEDEVQDERKVILEELRLRNLGAEMRLMKQYLPALVNNSRYAYRLPSGIDSIVAGATAGKIRDYYTTWYRPDLMAVIVVGDITVPAAKAMIEKYFSGLENPANAKPRTIYHVMPYTKKSTRVVTDAEATRYNFMMAYPAAPSPQVKTVADLRKQIIEVIFAQCMARQFERQTQKAHPPFTVGAFSTTGSLGGLTLNDKNRELTIVPITDFKTAIDSGVAVLINAAAFGFSQQDMELAKKSIFSAYENYYNERDKISSANFAEMMASNFMKGIPMLNAKDGLSYIQQLLPDIKLAEVNDFAKKMLQQPTHYFALATGPANGKIPLPREQALAAMIEAAFRQKPVPPSKGVINRSLLQQEPVAGKILSQTQDATLGTTTYQLSNGVEVTVKPTDYQKDQVLMSGMRKGGASLYGPEDKFNLMFSSPVISSMGFGNFTPLMLTDYLAGKSVNVNTGLSGITDQISGFSSVKDLSTMFELLYLKLTQPREDKDLFDGLLAKVRPQYAVMKQDPQNAFSDSLTKFIYHNDPFAPVSIPTEADLTKVDVKRILEIYKSHFGTVDGFSFFIVGNIDENTLKPLLEKYIASLPVTGVVPAFKDNGLRMLKGAQTFKFYKGKDAKSLMLDVYHGEIPYHPDLSLKMTMLGEAMTIQLLDTIREKMQVIYGGRVSGTYTRYPYSNYSIVAQLPCGPENIDQIAAELDREVAGYKQDGVSQVDLDKVKKAMIEHYREKLKENDTWMQQLQDIYFWETDKHNFLDYESRVNKVTAEDLKILAQQVLNGDHLRAASYPESFK